MVLSVTIIRVWIEWVCMLNVMPGIMCWNSYLQCPVIMATTWPEETTCVNGSKFQVKLHQPRRQAQAVCPSSQDFDLPLPKLGILDDITLSKTAGGSRSHWS